MLDHEIPEALDRRFKLTVFQPEQIDFALHRVPLFRAKMQDLEIPTFESGRQGRNGDTQFGSHQGRHADALGDFSGDDRFGANIFETPDKMCADVAGSAQSDQGFIFHIGKRHLVFSCQSMILRYDNEEFLLVYGDALDGLVIGIGREQEVKAA